jgi:predicted ATP-grasp superfamily ATP-dependent carboligase
MRALIVDSGEGRGSLAAARALARAGWDVGIACPSGHGLARLSRSVRYRHLVPALAAEADGFMEGVERACSTHAYDLVFPSSDGEILALSKERDRISSLFPYCAHEAVLRAIDKKRLADAARGVGLSTPPTASSADQASELWGSRALIVKENLHGTISPSGDFKHVAVESFADLAAAERRVLEIRASGLEPLVQPLIDGDLIAFTSVVNERGEMLARVQQVAERTYPRRAGLSARARTMPVDESLAEVVGSLLRSLGWFGLNQLQFIAPAGAPPMLLDFNGRFYGSLSLALAAGVNLPDTWGRIAIGHTVYGRRDARRDVRYQWLEGDLKAVREGPAGTLRGVLGCISYAWRSNASIWSLADPLPGALAVSSSIGPMLLRRRSKSGTPTWRRRRHRWKRTNGQDSQRTDAVTPSLAAQRSTSGSRQSRS